MYAEQGPATVGAKAGDRDQRRHVRVEHTGTVEFVGEGRRFSGQAVNISRTGMQVVVNLPDSYASVRSITFSLPNAPGAVDLPCRLVRRHEAPSAEGAAGHVLGVEFSYESEAQMLLIENYVRELREREILEPGKGGDLRLIPRAPCCIRGVDIDLTGVHVTSIDNISCEGLLMSFEGALPPQTPVRLRFRFPQDNRTTQLSGETVYVISQAATCVAGVRLVSTPDTVKARIHNFVVEASASAAVRRVHRRVSDERHGCTFVIAESQLIIEALRELQVERRTVYALIDGGVSVDPVQVEGLDTGAGTFWISRPCSAKIDSDVPAAEAYFSFYADGGSCYFRSTRLPSIDDELRFLLPETLLRCEKRSHQRKLMRLGSEVRLAAEPDPDGHGGIRGRLLDISWRGFLCEVRLGEDELQVVQRGRPISYYLEGDWGLGSFGVVRHVKRERDSDGTIVLRVGVEAGIRSAPCEHRTVDADQWYAMPLPIPRPARPGEAYLESTPVRYTNSRGQEIVALVNHTTRGARAPVVVFPPAFGKKKESLAPVAATLLATFAAAGHDLVTVRYDGVNRPGESHNDDPDPPRGSEMLHCRLSDGLEDLRATISFVEQNDFFEADGLVFVSFSMASLDVRKLLATRATEGVLSWVNCMGIPCGKSAVGRILGGIDIVGNHRMGIRSGIGGMLGYLVDLDAVAADMVASGYAYMTDARSDMSRIAVPTLWIFGDHDRWVDPAEISDVMSIGCGSDRRILQIPVGHNMRSSEDAARMFKTVAEHVFRAVHGKDVVACAPTKNEMGVMLRQERERLTRQGGLNLAQYWRGYLLGGQAGRTGYDFCYNIAPFREFIDLEAALVAPRGGDAIADIGSGTGLLLQSMAARLSAAGSCRQPAEFVAYDLVPEALGRARDKWDSMVRRFPVLANDRVEFVCQNLDSGPVGPVQELLDDPDMGFEVLRHRIGGLSDQTVDLMIQHSSPLLHRIARGCTLTPDVVNYINSTFSDGHRTAILDLNRAARCVRGTLQESDLQSTRLTSGAQRPMPSERASRGAPDVQFDRLDFGPLDLRPPPALPTERFSKVVASLFLSYIASPGSVLRQLYRALKPSGMILISTMKPDSDVSIIFTDFVRGVRGHTHGDATLLEGARGMLNDAAGLFSLEEEGYFRFYSADELCALLQAAGFSDLRVVSALGVPAQATIVTAIKPNS